MVGGTSNQFCASLDCSDFLDPFGVGAVDNPFAAPATAGMQEQASDDDDDVDDEVVATEDPMKAHQWG